MTKKTNEEKGMSIPDPVVDFVSRDRDGKTTEYLRIDKEGQHTVEVNDGNDD